MRYKKAEVNQINTVVLWSFILLGRDRHNYLIFWGRVNAIKKKEKYR